MNFLKKCSHISICLLGGITMDVENFCALKQLLLKLDS